MWRGVLVQGNTGSGKSYLLQNLLTLSETASYFDCCSARFKSQPAPEYIRLWLEDQLRQEKNLLLLDNVDDASQSNYYPLSSALAHLIDIYQSADFVIVATFTNVAKLDSALMQPYRLGPPLQLNNPSQQQRATLFTTLLGEGQRLRAEVEGSTDAHIVEDLSQRTQGCSAGDIVKIFRDCWFQELVNGRSIDADHILSKLRDQSIVTSLEHDVAHLFDSGANQIQSELGERAIPKSFWGHEAIKTRLRNAVMGPFEEKNTRLYRSLGIETCSGVLISGPPGSGKSLLAQWLIWEGRQYFKSVTVSCADLVNKVVGESEQKIAQLFALARKMAPCFLLLDNLDIILGQGVREKAVVENHTSSPATDSRGHAKSGSWRRSRDGAPRAHQRMERGRSGPKDRMASSRAIDAIRRAEREKAKARSRKGLNPSSPLVGPSVGGSTISDERRGAGQHSSRTSHAALDRLLSTLLVEIDGLQSHSRAIIGGGARGSSAGTAEKAGHCDAVIVVATAVDPTLLDRSLTRAGRLEEHVRLGLPDAAQRIELVRHLLPAGVLASPNDADGCDECECGAGAAIVEAVASALDGLSPAQIEVRIQEAGTDVIRDLLHGGTGDPLPPPGPALDKKMVLLLKEKLKGLSLSISN